MNVTDSTAECKNSENLTDYQLKQRWDIIDWKKAESEVNKLQARITKAASNKNWNMVKRLQYLLTHSFFAKALAVKKVTTNNGKNTPGIDRVLWSTPQSKMKAVYSLTDKKYKAKPLKRVYIEKYGKKEKRPLGIPTMYDRAMQALYSLALDPIAEATADSKSFGFRKGRSCHDACEHAFTALSRKYSAQWILEGDIKGCFDNISHQWLIDNIPMDKSVLKQFLKAGYIFKRDLFPTDSGTPQGGIISPILANMALDGLQKLLEDIYDTNSNGKKDSLWHRKHKVNLIRYADDFIVTAADEKTAYDIKRNIKDFLQNRGLELSESKTKITHINDGFDFLGWNFRKYNEKLIIKPSEKSIKKLSEGLRHTILGKGKAWTQDLLILKLNQQLRGWANYHQSCVAKEAFSKIDYLLWNLLRRWAKRRHHNKGKKWILNKYWRRYKNQAWAFSTDENTLMRMDRVEIVRHIKVCSTKNPYIDTEYFAERRFLQGVRKLSGKFKYIWRNQKGLCYKCGESIDLSEDRDIYYKVPKCNGGTDQISNLAYIHKYCK